MALAALLVYALVLGVLMAAWPGWIHALDDSTAMSALYSRGFFSSSSVVSDGMTPFIQINLLLAGLMRAAGVLGEWRYVAGWLAQSMLAAVLLFRAVRWSRRFGLLSDASWFFALLLVQPAWWASMLWAPSVTLTVWLLVESMLAIERVRFESHPRWALVMIALFALSLSGALGLALSCIVSIYGAVLLSRKERQIEALLPLLAVAPSVVFFTGLSWRWGVLGGVQWNASGPVAQPFSWIPLLNGEWTRNAQTLLLRMGEGVTLPFPLVAFGFLALLGVAEWMRESPREMRERGVLLLVITGQFVFTASFLPPETAWRLAAPVLLIETLFAAHGVVWAARRFQSTTTAWSLITALGVMFLSAAYFEFRPLLERALYRETLYQTTREWLDRREGISPVFIQFSPSLFLCLSDDDSVIPFEYAALGRLHSVEGDQRGRIASPLADPPQAMAFYAIFDDVDVRVAGDMDPVLRSLAPEYKVSWSRNLQTWERLEPGETLPDQTADSSIALESAIIGEPVGERWTFEDREDFDGQLGVAFGDGGGIRPTQGAGAAGSSSPDTKNEIGALESKPFVIEGDDLRFYASIPQDSTQSFFALAVYSDYPWSEGRSAPPVQHLFDHKPNESLMNQFVYVRPQGLRYEENSIRGWRVVRALQGGGDGSWKMIGWSLDPWRGSKAIWLAADRDPRANMGLDDIRQWKRPPGLYWNFEWGAYRDWIAEGEAFGDAPASGPFGTQLPVKGYEGNYFINSFYHGGDAATGALLSPEFTLQGDSINFLVGGGDDVEQVYVGLLAGGDLVIKTAGRRDETLRRVTWNISSLRGRTVRLVIRDQSSGAWGHILADDFRIVNQPASPSMTPP